MRSSANTPGPRSSGRVRLALWIVGEDHPKACTGRRLVARGRVAGLASRSSAPRGSILLDPHADVPLSPADRDAAFAGGIAAVDCSWRRLGARGGYPRGPWDDVPRGRRRLPLLIAGNAHHYGRLGELNTVEALAAALWVVGEPAAAEALLAGFPGGGTFLDVNQDRFRAYGAADGPERVRDAERALFAPG